MTQIVLEIENEIDVEPILAIARRLNIKHYKTTSSGNDKNGKSAFLRRREGLAKFGGILKEYKGYNPNKSEFYEQ